MIWYYVVAHILKTALRYLISYHLYSSVRMDNHCHLVLSRPKGRDREGSGLEESRLRATVTTVVSVFSFMLLLIVRIKS